MVQSKSQVVVDLGYVVVEDYSCYENDHRDFMRSMEHTFHQDKEVVEAQAGALQRVDDGRRERNEQRGDSTTYHVGQAIRFPNGRVYEVPWVVLCV